MKKIYTCFVCGEEFKEYELFKSHILDNHDSGTHYVCCPLKRCGAPVRDLKLHYKTCHPTEKLSGNVQFRATIWKDPKNPKKATHGRFHEGNHVSIKNNGQEMHYRSSYEKKLYMCLDLMPEIVKYEVEPFGVKYLYIRKTKVQEKTYYPDLKVYFADNHIEIWEVKPMTQTKTPMNIAKWNACGQMCLNMGWEFVIITENGINELLTRFAKELGITKADLLKCR